MILRIRASNKPHGTGKRISHRVTQGKENSSVGSQVLINPTDVEEVISPLKDLMKAKRSSGEDGDDRGGRRGNPIKSRLGPRTDAALQAKKKIARSPYRAYNPRKRQAVSYDESPKKKDQAMSFNYRSLAQGGELQHSKDSRRA
ncbi:hypothetical protein F2Q69_00052220 [Brassica cretica]|uniref:Uncharacterized protein n=1 Tax=Brassica cretica TaxID=69181 RepID=A0A8S9NA12_BRACR|nr:hypothetical protein F2Q69_00052220 [Brassica cretica]